MSGFVCRPISINRPMFFCATGRWTEEMKASQPAPISGSVGRLAKSTSRFRIRDGSPVKSGDARCKRVDEGIELVVCERTVHVTILLGQFAVDVVGSEQDFKRAPSAHQPGKPCHRTAARHEAGADLPL